MNINPETLIDGYKVDHRRQYAEGTEQIVSNMTARGSRRGLKKTVVFGNQYFIKRYLIEEWNKNFFQQPIEKVLVRFNRRINNYLGPNGVGDQHIRELHELGYLPLCIMALPEGTVVPLRVPSTLMFVTDARFGWLTNYFETIFSTTTWGMMTSATTAREYRKLFNRFAMLTVGNLDFVPWQGHDFSFRGMFGLEAACMSGAAHLLSFTGTDTIPAIDFLEQYYGADCTKEIIGGSVAATEHSVACSVILDFVRKLRIENAGTDRETQTYDELMNLADVHYVKRLITEIYPVGIVSIVADSFDYWNTITNTARVLKDVIMARDGKVVFRPDTGDPVKVVCGYNWIEIANKEMGEIAYEGWGYEAVKLGGKYYKCNDDSFNHNIGEELTEHEVKGSIECLWDIFGGTVTEKGYRLLDSHIGLIYGDSITFERAHEICNGLLKKHFASINLVYGIGSFTYQYVTRDTEGYAVKATFAVVKGEDVPIYKRPKTDDGLKNSAFGLPAVFRNEAGELYLKENATWEEVFNCEFVKQFENSQIIKEYTLAEVRGTLAAETEKELRA
jgi:nicotinamide phosphoribosyltransferase